MISPLFQNKEQQHAPARKRSENQRLMLQDRADYKPMKSKMNQSQKKIKIKKFKYQLQITHPWSIYSKMKENRFNSYISIKSKASSTSFRIPGINSSSPKHLITSPTTLVLSSAVLSFEFNFTWLPNRPPLFWE